jgi:hypothetical protein
MLLIPHSMIATLTSSLLPEWPAFDEPSRNAIHRAVTDFVVLELKACPSFVRLGVTALTVFFFTGSFVIGFGRGYGRRGPAWQRRYLTVWRRLGRSAKSFERLMRSLTVLAFLDHPLVAAKLGIDDGQARQERHRSLRRDLIARGVEA